MNFLDKIRGHKGNDVHKQFDVTDVDAEIKKQEEEDKEWEQKIRTTKETLATSEPGEHLAKGTDEIELEDADLMPADEENN